MKADELGLARFFAATMPLLDERQRRLVAGNMARMLGRGGVAAVARSASMSRNTVISGAREAAAGAASSRRVRRPGGGRKRIIDKDPSLIVKLDELVTSGRTGQQPLRWTSQSTARLAGLLRGEGFDVSSTTVGSLLSGIGFSAQPTTAPTPSARRPDRDSQYRYINEVAGGFLGADEPVISVETKRRLERQDDGSRSGLPDTARDGGKTGLSGLEAWETPGDSSRAATLTVSAMADWWLQMGRARFPKATRLLVCTQAGGSQGHWLRAFRAGLAAFAHDTALDVTVCHYPAGTAKWNWIEHRMLSHVTMSWQDRALVSYRTTVQLVSSTSSTHIVRIDPTDLPARGSRRAPPSSISPHQFFGAWNYDIGGRRPD